VCWWSPGPAEHEVVQDVHGVHAVLAGGVGVAADIQAVLGHVVAGQAPGSHGAGRMACMPVPVPGDGGAAPVFSPCTGR